ncbi:MAG: hypothetical protein DDT26_00656 [Dehalococcoidia bacterium]|nr:hypothetical protein [Chloroflexota bacterium]
MQLDTLISPFVASQFPALYREEGPLFIEFVKAYYEWLERDGGVWSEGKRLLDYRDIDTTLDRFIESFRAKYLIGVPRSVLGDPRTLQKHIKEVYASKGTPRGLKLLFRLLYNQDVDIYYPGDDLLRLSDGNWRQPVYLEISYTPFNTLLAGERVWMQPDEEGDEPTEGIVESIETKYENGRRLETLVLANVRGRFERGRLLFSDIVAPEASPIIKGSLNAVMNIGTSFNYQVGDVLEVASASFLSDGIGFGAKAVVSKVSRRDGTVLFTIADGGSGYTLEHSVITLDNPLSLGSGAAARVAGISNIEFMETAVDIINTQIVAGVTITKFVKNNVVDVVLNRTLDEVLDIHTLEMGTISRLQVVAAGQGYTGFVTATVRDDVVGGHQIRTANGSVKGLNGSISARAGTGSGAVDEVLIVDSGFGFRNFEPLVLSVIDKTRLESPTNPNGITGDFSGIAVVDSQGSGSGYWTDNSGFISNVKYIQDSFYFQEYSYEVQSALPFSAYASALRALWHPAGAEPFGRPVINDQVTIEVSNADEQYQIIEIELADAARVSPIEGESVLALDTNVGGVIVSLLP